MSITAKELREKRAPIAKAMYDLVEAAGKEGRSLNDEERVKFNAMEAEERDLATRADDIEKIERIRQSLGGETDPDRPLAGKPINGKTTTGLPTVRDSRMVWQGWALDPEFRTSQHHEAAERCGFDFRARKITMKLFGEAPTRLDGRGRLPDDIVQRATISQTTTLGSAGGNVIQNEPIKAIEEVLLAYGGMRQVAQVVRTNTGATLPWPKVDDTSNKGRVLAENTAADVLSLSMGIVNIGAFKYTSDIVKVSMELLQDSFMDLGSYLTRALGTRIGRVLNDHFTTGATDAAQPEGFMANNSTYHNSVVASDVNTFTYANLNSLVHSVDPAYRDMAKFLFSDNVLSYIKSLTDTAGRPLWWPGISAGMAAAQPPTLLGYEYVINQSMNSIPSATTGPGSTTSVSRRLVAFGDFSKYVIRDVRDVEVLRLNERYAEYAQTAFLAFSRHSGAPVGSTVAATSPWKFLVGKST